MAVGKAGLLPDGLLPVPRDECISSLSVSLHCGEIHSYLPSYEGSGPHYLALKILNQPQYYVDDHAHALKCFQAADPGHNANGCTF